MALYDVSTTEKKASPSLVAGGTLYADSPIGTILPYGGATAPSGWFLCQGQAVSRTTYSELFTVIGTSFGAGDDSTTFNLPDLRETVPVGIGENDIQTIVNHDVYTLGEFKDDSLGTHTHPLTVTTRATFNNAGVPVGIGNNNASTTATHGKQLGVNYIIKAKMVGIPADFLAKVGEVYQEKDLTSAVEGATTVEGALGALSTNKQPKTLDTPIVIDSESQTTVENALAALKVKKYVTSISNPSDLNDALGSADGDYCTTFYTYNTSALNKPITGGGQLVVYKQGNFLQQISISKRNYDEQPEMWIRVASRTNAQSPWTFGSWEKLVTESDLNPGTSKTDIDSNIVYYYRSGKVVTVVFNGFIVSSDVAQNARIGSLEFPHAVDSYGVYFTVADYNKNNVISVMRIDNRGYLLAASSASEQTKVVSGRYWGTVTYITG